MNRTERWVPEPPARVSEQAALSSSRTSLAMETRRHRYRVCPETAGLPRGYRDPEETRRTPEDRCRSDDRRLRHREIRERAVARSAHRCATLLPQGCKDMASGDSALR